MGTRQAPTTYAANEAASTKSKYGEAMVTVREISTTKAGELMKEGWVFLDVRLPEQVEKGAVQGAVEVPLFVLDNDMSPYGLIKQWAVVGTAGWWTGKKLTKANTKFLSDVLEKVDKEAPGVVVACMTGVRAKTAAEILEKAGYPRIAWIRNGLERTAPGEIPVVGDVDIRLAGV